ncbi:histidine kinase [Nostoc sp. MBR 210]|uniref:histidine kinase n=1 Tax=Nostoc spongiaeforme FACHB-130 TaxID=1357510 RepID=A0ABR8FTA4_9NOSO|nr:ATP-binding protein [Nostoc spongiaeforme]MBD2594652.1 GAF domain-containing sensor histidine kinase [Nostoc spongiaeforme FACHB-130]OCQ97365.1 histidine kinase [Nostoc sp. MBR 210]
MVKSNFRNLIVKKDVLALLNDFAQAIDCQFTIENTEGEILFGQAGGTCAIAHPIEFAGEVIGWVRGSQQASGVASFLTYALKQESEKKNLAHELLERYQEIDLLHDISIQVTASLNLRPVSRLLIQEAAQLIPSTGGAILLLNQKTNVFEILAEIGSSSYLQQPIKLGEGIIGNIVQMGRGEIVNNIVAYPRYLGEKKQFNSLICVPLNVEERVVGAIVIGSETAVNYTSRDLKLLSILAMQAGVAIEKALLYEQSCEAAKIAQIQAQQLQTTLHELQQTQAQLIQSEKMSSLGQLVAGIAHEINNPVNFISGNINHAQQYVDDLLRLVHIYQDNCDYLPEIQELSEEIDLDFVSEDLPKLISSMSLGIKRVREIVLSLRNFSRTEQSQMTPADIHEGIDSTLLILDNRLKTSCSNLGIEVIKNYDVIPLVECYPSQLNQVFMNILANAIDALDGQEKEGIITISTSLENGKSFTHSPYIVVRIQDNGSGMTQDVRDRLFEPFFTTKPIGKGTGLGMPICRKIIEKHNGQIECFSEPGQGTIFCIHIPISARKNVEVPKNMLSKGSFTFQPPINTVGAPIPTTVVNGTPVTVFTPAT